MKKLRIYIDTSVIGGCFDAEFSRWSNSLMRDFSSGTFTPILSDVLAAEIQDAPDAVRQEYNRLIGGEHELMLVTEEVVELVELGYKPLQIYSPREVTKAEGD